MRTIKPISPFLASFINGVHQTSKTPQKYTVVYNFNHSKMGFNNQVTVEANCPEQALEKAKLEVAGVYGTAMLKKFSFNHPLLTK